MFNYSGYSGIRVYDYYFSCHDIAFLHNLLLVILRRRLTPANLPPMYFFTSIDRLDNAEFKSKKIPRIAPTAFFKFVLDQNR